MYKDYNMTQHTLLMDVNDIAETIPDTEFDEFRHHRGLI